MDIKEFLEQEGVKELIAKGDLEAVYEAYTVFGKHATELTAYLFKLGINPLEYFKKSIPYAAFAQIKRMTRAVIPDSVTIIKAYAFFGCTNLTNIAIPDSVTSIWHWAFAQCLSLTSITIPDSVDEIYPEVFLGCTNLTNVTIGNGVYDIGYSVFWNCDKLTEINYTGTKAQWKRIVKSPKWRAHSHINVIHCIDGDILL